jgi:hypothetical protein
MISYSTELMGITASLGSVPWIVKIGWWLLGPMREHGVVKNKTKQPP